MEDTADWIEYRNKICYPVEKNLLGYPVLNKERLISAIISNDFLNVKVKYEQLKKIPADASLETMGDYVLDFAIFDNFAITGYHTSKEIDDFRRLYGSNENLQLFSIKCIHLQNYILWSQKEEKQKIWDQPTTIILADRFEMLIAVIYLEKGIEGVKNFLEKHDFFQRIDKIKEPSMINPVINSEVLNG